MVIFPLFSLPDAIRPYVRGDTGNADGDMDDDDDAFAAVETLNNGNLEEWENGVHDIDDPLQAVEVEGI